MEISLNCTQKCYVLSHYVFFIRFILSIKNDGITPLRSPVMSEKPGIIVVYLHWIYATMIDKWRYAYMIPGNVPMMEICHMPKVCSNKGISIWFCGNVDTCLNYRNMQQTKKWQKKICFSEPQLMNSSRNNLGLYSLSGKTSYCKISWSLEVTRFIFRLFQSLWAMHVLRMLMYSAALPRCLSNFRAVR